MNSRTRIAVASLILVQAISDIIIWTLATDGQRAQNGFALFLAVNLVAFSMISYIYRADKKKNSLSRSTILAGILFLLILLLTALYY